MLRLFSCLVLTALVAACAATSSYVPADAPASVSAPQVKVGDY